MWDKEIEFVKNTLIKNQGNNSPREAETFRKRNLHIVRVLKWARRIINSLDEETRDKLDIKAIELACIFHDVGYGIESYKNSHGIEGSKIFVEYAKENNFDEALTKKVSNMIFVHQNKGLLQTNVPEELTILMEADELDEEGCLSICWDMMVLGQTKPESFDLCLERLEKYSAHILDHNPMVHDYAINEWKKKQDLVKLFIESFKHDMFI